MLHKQKLTSKLHKLTNYKSNYTSTIYESKYKLVYGEYKPMGRIKLI